MAEPVAAQHDSPAPEHSIADAKSDTVQNQAGVPSEKGEIQYLLLQNEALGMLMSLKRKYYTPIHTLEFIL